MKIIRKSVFETNSSSTHVISITKHREYQLPKHVDFKFGEFGWEYEVYKDTSDKANYLYTMIKYFNNKEVYINTIKKYLDEENISYTFETETDESGYVDHGSCGLEIVENILESKEKLFSFLFDNKSYVTTGNDNDDGYYIPEIGCESDAYDEYTEKEWERQINKLKEDNCIYFKGN